MRHVYGLILLVICGILGGAGIRMAVHRLSGAHVYAQSTQAQRFDPVTIRYRETGGTGAKPYAGNFYVSRVVTVALRSDGGFVERSEVFNSGKQRIAIHRRLELPGGIEAEVDDHLSAVTALKHPDFERRNLSNRRTLASGCAARAGGAAAVEYQRAATPKTLLGLAANGFVDERPRMKIESWRAPDAGCFDLERTVYFKDAAGQVTDWVDLAAEEVIPGEPAPDLFRVPASYGRVPVSERYLLEVARAGAAPDPHDLARLRRMDSEWEKVQYPGPIE
jgi:hypothetical protein